MQVILVNGEHLAAIVRHGGAWVSPYINRFLSADTVVPNAANPQAYNRYSYVLGNPLGAISVQAGICANVDVHIPAGENKY